MRIFREPRGDGTNNLKRRTNTCILMFCALPLLGFIGCVRDESKKHVVVLLTSEQHANFDRQLLANYIESAGAFPVSMQTASSADIIQSAISILESSQPPDILAWTSGSGEEELMGRDLLQSLSSVWRKSDTLASAPPLVSNSCKVGSKYYLVPRGVSLWGIYYRPSVFNSHGLTVPNTWEDFIALCGKLMNTGITPITMGAKYGWPASAWLEYLTIRTVGPDDHVALFSGQVSFDHDGFREALALLKDMISRGFFIDDALSLAWAGGIKSLLDGTSAMYLLNTSIPNSWPEELNEDLGFFPVPVIDPNIKNGEIGSVDGWVITGQDKHAVELLSHMASKVPVYTPIQGRYVDFSLLPDTELLVAPVEKLAPAPLRDGIYNAVSLLWQNPSDDTIEQIVRILEADRSKIGSR